MATIPAFYRNNGKKHGLVIEPEDNVAVVTEDVRKGDLVSCALGDGEWEITAVEDIPVYHKIARTSFAEGDRIIKYGQIIGAAVTEIKEGAHVHCHNVKSLSRRDP